MLVELSQHAKKHNRIESESDKTFGEHPTFGKKMCGTESAQHWRRHGEEKNKRGEESRGDLVTSELATLSTWPQEKRMCQGLGGRRARTSSLPEALEGALWPTLATSKEFQVLAAKAEVPQDSDCEDIHVL